MWENQSETNNVMACNLQVIWRKKQVRNNKLSRNLQVIRK